MSEDSDVTIEPRKIYWRSRRGMLELDLLLGPFTLEAYSGLGAEDRMRYRQLLNCEDQDLHAWLMRREDAADYQPIIDMILAHNSANSGKSD